MDEQKTTQLLEIETFEEVIHILIRDSLDAYETER